MTEPADWDPTCGDFGSDPLETPGRLRNFAVRSLHLRIDL